jgi:hypothetical protein
MSSFTSNKYIIILDTFFHYSAVISGSLVRTSTIFDYNSCGLLRCDAASLGEWFKVQDMQEEILFDILIPEDEYTMFLQNIRYHSPNDAVSYP